MMDEQHEATAYHEAAHAAVGYWFGWQVGPDGIRIGDDPVCFSRVQSWAYTLQAELVQGLAGALAERKKFRPDLPMPDDEELDALVDAVRHGHDDDAEGDWGDAMRAILTADPDASNAKCIALYREHERQTLRLLGHPPVWSAVEAIAAALLGRERLTNAEAIEAVGESYATALFLGHYRNEI